MFNKGEGGFLDRDLYPFCGNTSDGKILAVASPNAKPNLGKDIRTLKDSTGKVYGEEIFSAGQKPEGEISEVGYLFARTTDPAPVAKVSFVTRVTTSTAASATTRSSAQVLLWRQPIPPCSLSS